MKVITVIQTSKRRATEECLAFKTVPSPFGRIQVTASPSGIVSVDWVNERHPSQAGTDTGRPDNDDDAWKSAEHFAEQAVVELREYFIGARREFQVPIVLRGTAFQTAVWSALEGIPYGETRSYRDIAHSIGSEKAVRAVGQANRRNPVPIIIPCHRVIGASGAMVGYAGSNIGLKEQLLALEQQTEKQWTTVMQRA